MSTPQIHTIESAEDLLIRDCMRAQGMGWKALPRPSGIDRQPSNRLRYGLVEPELATRFGYHLPPEHPETTRREAAWEAREKLPDREQLAAFGKEGGGGCWKQAHESLRRGLPQVDQSQFNRRIGAAFSASRRDPAYARVVREWSACLKEKGFRYANPLAVMRDAEWAKSTRPSRREIAVAQADVQCKQQTELVTAWVAVETRIQNEVIRSHPAEFRARKVRKDHWLAAARRVIERG
ncbi:hypothetical protein ACWGI8_16090 [Streptomyces sp. NPDC054841]